MNSPFGKIEWNKYEASLLIEAYKNVEAGDITRENAISKLSIRLRNRMLIHGISIGETYRNTNGINLQMYAIEYCLTNGEKGCIKPSQLFRDMVLMYVTDEDKFKAILIEAKEMYPEPIKEYSYQEHECVSNILRESNVEHYRYLPRFRTILSQRFSKGFRLNSIIATKQFNRYYEELFGEELLIDNEELNTTISSCGLVLDDKLYLHNYLLDDTLKMRLEAYIKEVFTEPNRYIFYEVLFNEFYAELLDSRIADKEMFEAYLRYCYDDKWYFSSHYFANIENVKIDSDEIVVNYVLEQCAVVSEDDAIAAISYLPEDWVRQSFNRNNTVLITNGRGSRFHIDIFVITSDELNRIIQIIALSISKFGFIGADELMDDLKKQVPSVIENNSPISELGIRNVLALKLSGQFSFNRSVISNIGENISAVDALLTFAKSHDKYSLAEIDQLASTLGTVLNYHLENISKYSCRLDNNNFISNRLVEFDCDKIDDALSLCCDGDFMPLKNITNFASFPPCGHVWNLRLLESFLLISSKMFKLLYGGHLNKNNISGTVVKCNSQFKSFDDVVIYALATSEIRLTKNDALDFLADEGYIVQRRFATIDNLLIKANELRNKLKD